MTFHPPSRTTKTQIDASARLLRWLPATGVSLVGAAEERTRRPQHDLRVDERRTVFDVPEVELDPLGPGELRATVDLRPAGDSRLDVEPVSLALVVLIDLVTQGRTRPDQRHLAADDVPELRQLVEGDPAQQPPHPRDARVTPVDGVAGADGLGSDDHRAQLEELE